MHCGLQKGKERLVADTQYSVTQSDYWKLFKNFIALQHVVYIYWDIIWYRENGVLKNWIWPQKRERLLRGHPLMPLVAPKKVFKCPKSPLKIWQNFDQKCYSSHFGQLWGNFCTDLQVSYHFGKLRHRPQWFWSKFEPKSMDQWEITSWKLAITHSRSI